MPSAAAPAPTAAQTQLLLVQLDDLPPLSAAARRLLAADATPVGWRAATLLHWDAGDRRARLARLPAVAAPDGLDADDPDTARVARAGWAVCRRAALAAELASSFLRSGDGGGGLDWAAFWKHSVAVGLATARLAADLPALDAETAFDAGLLHDLGKAALNAGIPRSYARVLERADALHTDIAQMERAMLGFDHTTAGRRIAERWGLPAPLAAVAWLHHQRPEALPATLPHRELALLVQLADALALRAEIGYSGNHGEPEWSDLAGELGLAFEAVERAADGLASVTEQVIALAGLDAREMADADALNADAESAAGRQTSLYWEAARFIATELPAGAGGREAARAAARVLRATLRVPAVAVFVPGADPRWLEVAWFDRKQGVADLLPIDLLGGGIHAEMAALPRSNGALEFTAAPAGVRRLLARFVESVDDLPCWLLPLRAGERFVGGVVVVANEARILTLRAAEPDLGHLLKLLTIAIEHATARAAASHLADELARTLRQLADARAESLRNAGLALAGEMAAGAAHELNNPLAVIAGRAQQLAARLVDDGDRRAADTIVEQARRASQIISDLAGFAQPPKPQPREIDLPTFLAGLRADWLQRAGLSESALGLQLSDELTPVVADAAHLRQILDEVLQNALDATDVQTRRLSVKAAPHPTDDAHVISVVDNGRGMAPEVRQRAFDPFFSQRPAGRGRGLGLSLAHRLVLLNGGRIRLGGAPGGGAIVEITLPVIAHR